MKQGINTTSTSFTLAAPPTSGQSVNYLIQAQVLESDQVPVVLPYYNAANPSQPYTGPNNAGTSQNTQRNTRVQLQLKAGAPATAGAQATPAVDAGWVGLYVVTVSFGQSQITTANLSAAQLVTAPFVDALRKGRGVQPGRLLNVRTFTTRGTYTYVPSAGTNSILVEVQGAGGGGGSAGAVGTSGFFSVGGGGAAGSYGKSLLPISSVGTSQVVTIGVGGVGGTNTVAGTGGTSSSFGAIISAPGGGGGAGGSPVSSSTVFIVYASSGPSVAVGGNLLNSAGGSGFQGVIANGNCYGGSGGMAVLAPGGSKAGGGEGAGNPGQLGSGGGGGATIAVGTSWHPGGDGGDGAVIINEYS